MTDFDNGERDVGFVVSPARMKLSSETDVQDLGHGDGWADFGIRFSLMFQPKAPRSLPYQGTLTIQGVVRMHGGATGLERKRLAVVNGVSLLYGVARDMVCAITGRSTHGQMLLPTLDFRALADSIAQDPQDGESAPKARARARAESPSTAGPPANKARRRRVAPAAARGVK
ncbi:hypothetical protein CDN99_19650 [Roseateles aquatilis]|uniref:Uncharacterized protein n=1 Tax=Roseateles aquatilis TaxID=431061 RepID=A0A246J395_9BURK|nr:hypothetical protein CDN99_19650 [Roseateles aquatilis]